MAITRTGLAITCTFLSVITSGQCLEDDATFQNNLTSFPLYDTTSAMTSDWPPRRSGERPYHEDTDGDKNDIFRITCVIAVGVAAFGCLAYYCVRALQEKRTQQSHVATVSSAVVEHTGIHGENNCGIFITIDDMVFPVIPTYDEVAFSISGAPPTYEDAPPCYNDVVK